MNIIENIAKELIEENYSYSENKNYFLNALDEELARHRKQTDKVMLLSKVRDLIQEMYDEHYENCREREDCQTLKWNLQSIHYVNNILLDYSAPTNHNVKKDLKETIINNGNMIINQNSKINKQATKFEPKLKESNWSKANVIITLIVGIATIAGVLWQIFK